jgi:hypothetical protein
VFFAVLPKIFKIRRSRVILNCSPSSRQWK